MKDWQVRPDEYVMSPNGRVTALEDLEAQEWLLCDSCRAEFNPLLSKCPLCGARA